MTIIIGCRVHLELGLPKVIHWTEFQFVIVDPLYIKKCVNKLVQKMYSDFVGDFRRVKTAVTYVHVSRRLGV